MMGYGIVIRGESGWIIKMETTPYLGKLYTYVEFMSPVDRNSEENYFPTIRAIVPPWVWRKVKKMISNGVDVKQIENFVFNVVKEFVSIKHNGQAHNHLPHLLRRAVSVTVKFLLSTTS
jgi:hypothetical protein